MEIPMWHYSAAWPAQFEQIKSELSADLAAAGLKYTSIIHIGSTAVPGLNAKPWIDILITIPFDIFASEHYYRPLYVEALLFGDRQGGYHYIGNGGLKERWSFKLGIRCDRDGRPVIPERCVYIVPDGGIHHRSSVAVRDVLMDEVNGDLKEEYGKLKWELVARTDYTDIWQYAALKNGIIRKILGRAGWKDKQIAEKEAMREEHWPEHLTI